VLQPLAAARWTLAALAAGLVALMLVATSTYEAFGGAPARPVHGTAARWSARLT
jgi:hypothetical protein